MIFFLAVPQRSAPEGKVVEAGSPLSGCVPGFFAGWLCPQSVRSRIDGVSHDWHLVVYVGRTFTFVCKNNK